MSEMPEDIVWKARAALYGRHQRGFIMAPVIGEEKDTPAIQRIASALFAERQRSEERIKALERTVEFVGRWAWRTDPPNANNRLTDEERFSAIKYHPRVKSAAQPHIELAEREAALLRDQEERG